MFADKADRHHHQIVGLRLAQFLKGLLGVWLEPPHRAHTALVRQGEGVVVAHLNGQLLHDQIGAGFDLFLIGVAGLFDVALRHTVGAEEDMGLRGIVAVADLCSDQLGHGLHISRVVKPAADAANRQLLKRGIRLPQALKLAETGSTRADREMGVERKHHHLIHAVGLDIRHCGFGKWMPVAHGHVAGGIDAALTQQALKFPGLLLRDSPQW